MTPKIGYLLPTRENIMQGQPSGKLLLDAAREAQALGFDSVWAGDSMLARPRHDPLTLLAAVAGAVPDVQIGTAVLLPALRNPVVLAKEIASLDVVCNGRLLFGIGAGYLHQEFAALGVEFSERGARTDEYVHAMRALWNMDKPVFKGK